jgi:hypothetical protein
MIVIEKALSAASAIAAFLAAYYWYQSAQIQSPKEFPIRIFSSAPFSAEIPPSEIEAMGSSAELDAIGKALIDQSKLNSRAATFAAISALLSGLAAFV